MRNFQEPLTPGTDADPTTLAGFADLAARTAANQRAVRDAIRADDVEPIGPGHDLRFWA